MDKKEMAKVKEVIESKDYSKILEMFTAQTPKYVVEQTVAIKQYKTSGHEIFDPGLRKDKKIIKDSGEVNANGEPILVPATVKVARVGVPFQKVIVERRTGFMLSEPVKTEAVFEGKEATTQEETIVKMIEKIQNDNKMDYKNKDLARRLMSEMQVAEIWYFDEKEKKDQAEGGKYELKMKVLSPDLGDSLYPLFDTTGDMIAFARGYKIKEDYRNEVEHFDIFTAEAEYKFVNRPSWMMDDQVMNPVPNPVGKIMIVYYEQLAPEWHDVQSMIDRFETNISNHADINDYFGSPILTIVGELLGYAQKGETGKILQLANGSTANYLALASEPQSIAMEQENLEKFIYAMTQTPDITFEQMKGLGAVSGVALKLLFLDAHMAVKNKEEIFGIGLQRRLNLIKECIGKVLDVKMAKTAKGLQVKPVLTPYLPQNETEMIDMLVSSVNGGVMSTKTAIEQNPLVEDADEEEARLDEEQQEAMDARKEAEGWQMTGMPEEKEKKPKNKPKPE